MSNSNSVFFLGSNSAKPNVAAEEGSRSNSAIHHLYSSLANNPSRAECKLPVMLIRDINYPQPESQDIPPRTGPQ